MNSQQQQHHHHPKIIGRSSGAVRLRSVIVFFSLLAAAILFVACSGKSDEKAAQQQQRNAAVAVEVGKVETKDMPVQLRAVGTVEAYSTVSVRSQVAGVLSKVHFQEGQEVRKGDPLFTIDPRPFEAMVAQAQANLARDEAQARQAKDQVTRYQDLVKKDYVTQEQFDQIKTTAEASDATVKADQAALDNARLQLSYCSIHSPVDGKTSDLKVHEGNLVKVNDTELLTINQIKPIYVRFALPQDTLEEVQQRAAGGTLKVQATSREASPAGGNPESASGTLSFINNAVDASTGTFQLKAEFPNQEELLWPGQFVDVVITLTTAKNAVVVASQAIQTGQQGDYVFVVKPDRTVEMRRVKVRSTGEHETIVAQGLNPGETVVTDGQLNLVPGARVDIKNPAKV